MGAMHHRPWRESLSGLVLYAAAVALMIAACLIFRETPREETLGQLDGRFESAITYQQGDEILHYREATLTNLLLIGVDREEAAAMDGLAQEGGQADFLLLVTADRENRAIILTHIDRDTITEIGTYGIFGDRAGSTVTQICLAHAFGSTEAQRCENTVQAVSELFGGIVIEGYIAMDMGEIARLNDALGGVTVTLEDDFSAIDATMTAGATLTLQGDQAEIFLRYRSMLARSTNERRMQRQRTYMTAALTAMDEKAAADWEQLLSTMQDSIHTNVAQAELADDLNRWQRYDRSDIQPMKGSHTIDEDGFVAFYPDQAWMEQYLTAHFFE